MAAFAGKEIIEASFQESRKKFHEHRAKRTASEQGWNELDPVKQAEMGNLNRNEVAYKHRPSLAESITVAFIRGLQLVFALTVSGLYGVDLQHACDKHVYADAKWVYAEVVAALAAVSSTTYLIIWLLVRRADREQLSVNLETGVFFWLWGPFMCILWLTLFGIFGKMYLSEDPEGVSGIVRMKSAVWIDLVNLILWVITTTWSATRWWQYRERSPKKEGKAGAMKTATTQTARAQTNDANTDAARSQDDLHGDIAPGDANRGPRQRAGYEEEEFSPAVSRQTFRRSYHDAPAGPQRG